MKKRLVFLFVFHLSIIQLFANPNYKIEIEFKGKTDSALILANYYGNTFQVKDTFAVHNNKISISGSDTLKPGVYTLAKFNKEKIMDFVVNEKPFFRFKANMENMIDSVRIYNSPENEYFFRYLQLNAKRYKLIQKAQSNQTKLSGTSDAELERNTIQTELQLLKNEVQLKLKNSVLDIIFTSMEEPKVPSVIANDRQSSYLYFKEHYWDRIALDDERMLKTPVFHNKLEFYFDRIIMQHPDTLAVEIDRLLEKDICPEIKKYIIWTLALKYEQPKIMGLDKVFIHIVDKHFNTENLPELTQSIIDNFMDRANKMRPLLIGEPAPNLIMIDTLGNFDALNNHFKKEYTLVFFWDSNCQTCHKEIKELKKLLEKTKHSIEVFAVGTDTNLGVWRKYIREHKLNWTHVNGTKSMTKDYHDLYNIFSTPTTYILDKNKKIIGKNLIMAQLEGFLDHHSKRQLK